MGEFLKIGGKYTDSLGTETAKGISVNEDGQLTIVRRNEVEIIDLLTNVEKRDSTAIQITGNTAVDLREWTTCCIFVTNQLDIDVTLQFYTQKTITGTSYLKYMDGSNAKITLPHMAPGAYIITPDDLPLLNYLNFFKCTLQFATAPTSGYISLGLMRKR